METLKILTPFKPEVRTCGGCTACCRVMRVDDTLNVRDEPMTFRKPRHTWCEHAMKGKGCAIYEYRPQQCAQYLCLWAQGHGVDEMRPDRCGIMVDTRAESSVGPVYILHEVQPNKFIDHADMVGYWSLAAAWGGFQMTLIRFNHTQGLSMAFKPTQEQSDAIRNRMARPDAAKLRPWLARLGLLHQRHPPDLQMAEKVIYQLAWGTL